MAITYPRALPAYRFGSFRFSLRRGNDLSSPDGSLKTDAIQFGFPYWEMEAEAVAMNDKEQALWEAWLDSLAGSANQFIGRDIRMPCPASIKPSTVGAADPFTTLARHGGAAGSFATGDASTWSLDGTRTVLTMTGLPSTFVITAGDPVGFRWTSSTKFHLVRALETITAAAGVAAVTVNPAVWATVPAHATGVATLKQPGCLMKMTSRDPAPSDTDEQWRERFTARQVLVA